MITSDAGGLAIDFRYMLRMSGPLQHWQYDSFITRFINSILVTFDLDADGRVSRITMKPASLTADFGYDYQNLDSGQPRRTSWSGPRGSCPVITALAAAAAGR